MPKLLLVLQQAARGNSESVSPRFLPRDYASQVQVMDSMVAQFSERRKEMRTLFKNMRALKAKMEDALVSVLRWLRGGYLGANHLPRDVAELADHAKAHPHLWTTGAGAACVCGARASCSAIHV